MHVIFLLLATILAVAVPRPLEGEQVSAVKSAAWVQQSVPPPKGSLRDLAAHGAALYSEADLRVRAPWPEHTKYPRLGGPIYSPLMDTPKMLEEMSRFDILLVGRTVCYSSGAEGGFAFGKRRGEGCGRGTLYNLNRIDGKFQRIVVGAKQRNRNLKFLVQATITHIQVTLARYPTDSPERFFIDNLSPRYFAYTPLIRLEKAVPDDPRSATFRFRPSDLKRAAGIVVIPPGKRKWNLGNAYDWTYCCFYDNDNHSRRGCYEVMAVAGIDPGRGVLRVVRAGRRGRTLLGTPQSYRRGARFGFLSSSNRDFGGACLYMNRTTACEPADGEGGPLTWIDYVVRHLVRFALRSKYRGIYLADGIFADADKEDANTMFAWRFMQPKRFFMDFDRDGRMDRPASASRAFMEGMKDYAKKIRRAAKKIGRDEIVAVKNGAFLDSRGRIMNGRMFEDFNGRFQDPGTAVAEKRYIDQFKAGRMRGPVVVVVNERVKHGDKRLIDWRAHRHTMAFTCIAGEGYYTAVGPYSLGFKNQPGQKTDRWYDEYSVDPRGVGCNHSGYSGKTPASFRGWLGKPLTPGVKLAARTYAREFEHGVALCTFSPGGYTFNMGVLFPGARFRRILGADDSSVNSGADVGAKLFVPCGDGIFLVRTQP